MPFVSNPIDAVQTYFEDDGGNGAPVVFFAGLMDPIALSRSLPLAAGLKDEFRLIFADHRGHGRSDKPHDVEAYGLRLRVADAIAVLDALELPRAHFIGLSWGARLAFAIGERAAARVASLVLCGNQPYAWDKAWPLVAAASAIIDASARDGMEAGLRAFGQYRGEELAEPERSWFLDNDPLAISAAWNSALTEGAISADLAKWQLPCLILAGQDDDMHDNASRAAAEIPGARFLSLAGRDHFSAVEHMHEVLPEVLRLLRSAG